MRQPVARHLHGRVRCQAEGPQGNAAGAQGVAAHSLGGEAARRQETPQPHSASLHRFTVLALPAASQQVMQLHLANCMRSRWALVTSRCPRRCRSSVVPRPPAPRLHWATHQTLCPSKQLLHTFTS